LPASVLQCGAGQQSHLSFSVLSPQPVQSVVNIISQPPVLTEMPASYTAFSRDDINLTCEATGNPTPMFRWVKDGNEFGSERTGSGSLRAEEDEPLSTYQGTYRCYASNNLGTAMTHAVQLIIERERIHKKAEEGESMILPCNPPKSSIRPNIHWMDSEMFHITRNDRVVKGLDGNLYFANILKSDSRDDYTCHAQYPDARTILPNEPVTLTVISISNRKPHLFHPSGLHSSVLTVRGNSLTLECIPRGLPTPTVEWRKKDGNIKDTGAQLKNFNRWLHFRSISQEDDGEYECKASNSQGSAVHSFTVTVEAKPYWVKEPQSLLYAPGETVRLDCQAEGIPTPTITWSINGLHLTGTDPRRTVSGGVLILRDVEFADTAVYQCEAFNKHGSILTNTYIYVIELPPQILSSDGVVYQVIEGRNASLDCETFGSPRPHVTWEGDGMLPLLSDSRVSLLTNGTIELSNVGHDDSGTYTCSIRHTNISIMAHLEVLNRTVILNGPQHVRTLNGTSALLDCHFYKDPRLLDPQIVWKRDGAKILESSPDDKYIIFENATLKLTYVQLEDTGNYSCEVITSKDHVAATGSITVVARPDPPHSLTLSDVQDRSLTLSWKPGRSHNSHITEFIVEAREEQHTPERKWRWEEWKWVSGDINHLELMLQPYSTYRFRVIGVNEAGRSEPSQHSEAHTTPPAVPDGNPTGVHSDSTDPGFLVISWDEMDRLTHNAPGFEYKVSWRQAEGSNQFWSHGTTKGPPFVVNGTGTYTPFEIKVQAVNSLGEGPAPVPEIGHSGEDTPLEAPGDVTVKVINSTASVRWETPQGVRGLLLGYRHGMGKEQENRVVEVGSMKNSEEVTGLRLYSRYELSVTAFNSKGEGPHSPPYHFSTPEGAPGPPASLRLDSPSETSITLYWTPPIHTNGVLLGYFVQFKQDMEGSTVEVEEIMDPSLTHHVWDGLDPHSSYIFTVTARTAAGEGPPITRKGTTLLDGGALSFTVATSSPETNVAKYNWVESEMVNSTQGFYSLAGLQPGTKYWLTIMHRNYTHWKEQVKTKGPEVAGGFATQGWFIGLISAIVLLMLILLILCFIKRSKGGKYAVKDKEDGQVDSEARPMKDETFGEYSDGDEKRSISQPSLCVGSKLGSDDSLAEYGNSVDIQFNEDGSFIGQYSGREPVHHGNESSGPASPVNPVPPPPIAPSMSTFLDRPS
uniref:Neural cell adhesion molecule L1 n=1 Tax=Myripristis murdjan TaxID=586833 RepID=A0A667Z1U1_9TELE